MASNAVSVRTTETAPAAKHGVARWWLVAPTLILFVIINQLDKSNISVLIADRQFLADLHLTGQPARIGFLSSAFFYAYGASLMIWGFMVDRFGPRRSAICGVLGWAVTTAWCAVAASATEMYIARFALGLAEGCMWPVCNSYAGRWFAVREHGASKLSGSTARRSESLSASRLSQLFCSPAAGEPFSGRAASGPF
jgi:MFS family permease